MWLNMKRRSFHVSDYGNLLMYDKKYSAEDVRYIIETNRLNGLRIFDDREPLHSLDFLRQFTFLKKLEVACRYDQDFSFLADLPQLNHFTVGPSCPMKNEIDLTGLTNVKYLSIQWATNHINGLESCRETRDLCLVEFPQKDLEGICVLANVVRLRVKTGSMKSLRGVELLGKLEEVEIGNCRSLSSITHLNGLGSLRSLRIESCRKIEDYGDLSDLPGLSTFQLINCGEIPDFDSSSRFPNLLQLELLGRTKIKRPAIP